MKYTRELLYWLRNNTYKLDDPTYAGEDVYRLLVDYAYETNSVSHLEDLYTLLSTELDYADVLDKYGLTPVDTKKLRSVYKTTEEDGGDSINDWNTYSTWCDSRYDGYEDIAELPKGFVKISNTRPLFSLLMYLLDLDIWGVPEGKSVRNIIDDFDSEYSTDVHG